MRLSKGFKKRKKEKKEAMRIDLLRLRNWSNNQITPRMLYRSLRFMHVCLNYFVFYERMIWCYMNMFVGVCLVSDEVEQGGFQKEEEAMLTCFCHQIGVAIASSQRVSRVMQTEGIRPADTSAAEYLIGKSDVVLKLL